MRLTAEHHEIIVNFAEAHPEIITNKFMGLNARQNQLKLWEKLVDNLNSLGYGVLSVAEYKRRITDWKSKTKAKAADIKKNLNMTGGGEGYHSGLLKIEQRLLSLMGNKAYEGDGVDELGFKRTVDTPSRTPSRSTVAKPALFGQDTMLQKKGVRICGEKSSLVSKLSSSFSALYKEDSPVLKKKIKESSQFDKPATVTSETLFSGSTKPFTHQYEPENDDFEDTYTEDVLVEVVEESESSENVTPSTGYLTDHKYHKTEETQKIPEPRTVSASTTRRKNLSHMSESIQKMNSETLDVLRSIDKKLEGVTNNLAGIDQSLKAISSVLTQKIL